MKNILLFCIATLILTSCKFSGHHSGPLSKGDTIRTYSADSNWEYDDMYDTLNKGPVFFAISRGHGLVHLMPSDIYTHVNLVIRNYKNQNRLYFALMRGEAAPFGKGLVLMSLDLDGDPVQCIGGYCPPLESKRFIYANIKNIDNVIGGIKLAKTLTLDAFFTEGSESRIVFKVSGLTWNHTSQADTAMTKTTNQ